MKLAVAALTAILLLSVSVRADTLYDVNGTGTITGNDVCNGPCVESFTFSLVADEQVDAFGDYYLVAENPVVDATGPLGPFTGAHFAHSYLALDFGSGSEIDFSLFYNDLLTPFVPGIADVPVLYACGDDTCVTEFSPTGPTGPLRVIMLPGTGSVSVNGPATTPEPGTLSLLLCGLGIFWMAYRYPVLSGRCRFAL